MLDDAWLSLVHVAKETGNISSLFPPGIERITDLPFTIHQAILSALNFLSFGELPKDERPPKSIWLDDKKMTAWWAEVERLREAKYGGGGDQSKMEKSNVVDRLIVGLPDHG